MDALRKIIGNAYSTQINDLNHALEKPNSKIENQILISFEECCWGGNKQQAGKLKTLVTSDVQTIRHLYANPYEVKNYANCIFLSNEDWVVPFAPKERRFLCLNVNDKFCGMETAAVRDYMTPLFQMETIKAFAKILYSRDISEFNSREIPHTDAAIDQKAASLGPVEQWWEERLSFGLIVQGYQWEEDKNVRIPKHVVFLAFTSSRPQSEHPVANVRFWKTLKTVCPEVGDVRTKSSDGTRTRCATFPPLKACREAFREYIGEPGWCFEDGVEEEIEYAYEGSNVKFVRT